MKKAILSLIAMAVLIAPSIAFSAEPVITSEFDVVQTKTGWAASLKITNNTDQNIHFTDCGTSDGALHNVGYGVEIQKIVYREGAMWIGPASSVVLSFYDSENVYGQTIPVGYYALMADAICVDDSGVTHYSNSRSVVYQSR